MIYEPLLNLERNNACEQELVMLVRCWCLLGQVQRAKMLIIKWDRVPGAWYILEIYFTSRYASCIIYEHIV